MAYSTPPPTPTPTPSPTPAPTPAPSVVWRGVLVQSAITIVSVLVVIAVTVGLVYFHFRPTPPAPPVPTDISVPAKLTTQVGVILDIEADSKGSHLQWFEKSGPMEASLRVHDEKTCHFAAALVGDYVVGVYTAIKDKPSAIAYCAVRVDPYGPGPVPPDPPVPPTPPVPPNPLTTSLQTAFDQDHDADKTKSLDFLKLAYKGMAAQAPGRPEQTNAAFVAWMKTVVESPGVGLTIGQVKALRTAVAAELSAAWGPTPVPLTATDAAKELQKIADALQGVK